MKTKIFSHGNTLGIESSLDKCKFMNDPTDNNQVGMICSIDEVEITQEAIDVIRKAEREAGSFAEIMLSTFGDSTTGSISILGKGFTMIHKPMISRNCDISILDQFKPVKIDLPEDFIVAVKENFPE